MTAYRTISADSHVVEPPTLWTERIEPALRSRAPRAVRRDGTDVLVCEDLSFPAYSLLAAAGKDSAALDPKGTFEESCPRGAWEPKARLAEMEIDGVQAEVLYPSLAMRMFAIKDEVLQAACFRAYNGWIADFCQPYPSRLKGLGLIGLGDIGAAGEELQRCARLGLAGACISISPDPETPYESSVYEPFWAAAAELGMPLSLHVGTDRRPSAQGSASANVGYLVYRSIDHYIVEQAIATLIFSGVLHRHPGLRVVSAENDIGWAGYLVERMDYMFERRKNLTRLPIPRDTLPSEYFHRQVSLTFMRDRAGILVRHLTGVDNLLWASDYPHTDSTWPDSRKVLEAMFQGVPEAEQRKMTVGNATRLYGFPAEY